jgi:HK97 gp10 family phage protein
MAVATVKFSYKGELFVKGKCKGVLREAIKLTVKQGQEVLRGVTPVDTGYMRDRWRRQTFDSFTGGDFGKIYNDTYYLEFVDKGTSRIKARKFVARGIDQINPIFQSNLEKALDQLK